MSVAVNHPVVITLETLLDKVSEIRARYHQLGGNEYLLDELEHILSTLQVRLRVSDSRLIASSTLNNLNNQLNSNAANVLRNIQQIGLGQLPNLAQCNQQLVAYVYQIPVLETPAEAEAFRDSLVNMRRSLSQHVRQIEEERGRLGQQSGAIDELLQQATTNLQRTDDQLQEIKDKWPMVVDEFNAQFSQEQERRDELFGEEQEVRGSELRQETEDRAAEFHTQLNEFHSEFEQQVEASKNRFNELIDKFESNQQEMLETTDETIQGHIRDWTDTIQNIIDEMMVYHQQAAELAGAIATTTHAGAYKKIADKEEHSASVWRWTTMSSFALLVVAAAIEFYFDFIHPVHGFQWSEFSGRMVITAAIAALAGYAAKQSSGHARNEQHNRKMELILRSIDPYLQSLEPDARRKIKEELAQPLFNTREVAATTDGTDATALSPDTILKVMASLVSRTSDK